MTSRLSNFKAKKPGSKCLQRDLTLSIPGVEGSDDCLYLNVYVPKEVQRNNSEKLPVMFFVHGGGYVVGQADIYKSNNLLDKDVILVTLNYRLGTLGFLTTEDGVIPGNLGLKDQVAALRWVHENIAAFGGDPNLVTVFGQSAGSASTEFLMTSPLTKGLIHRIIAMSGSSFGPWAISRPGEMAENRRKAATHLGCPAEPSKDLLDCLQTKTAEEITEVDFTFPKWGPTPIIPFKPVIEGDVPGAHIPHHPKKLFLDGRFNDVPYMSGVTSEEGTYFTAGMSDSDFSELDKNFSKYAGMMLLMTPDEKEKADTLRKVYFSPGPLTRANIIEGGNMCTDRYFLWPALEAAMYHSKFARAPGYFYYFASAGSRSFLHVMGIDPSSGNYGVSHGDDLVYLFSLPLDLKPTPQDVLMSIILTDIYSSFARDGVPSSKLLQTKWHPVTTKGSDIEYLHFKSPLDITMQKDLLPERWNLWRELFYSKQRHDEL